MSDAKTTELRRKIREIEQENEQLQARLGRSAKHLMRLRLERRFLLEKLQQLHPEALVGDPSASAQATQIRETATRG